MIHLTKKQSILISLLIIACFFGLSLFLISHNSSPSLVNQTQTRPTTDLTESQDSEDGQSIFALKNFYRSETKMGKKLWEIKAKSGEYFPANNKARITDATIFFYQDNGDIIRLDTHSADLILDNGSLTKAVTNSHTVIHYNQEMKISTDQLTYDKTTNLISSNSRTTITRGDLIIEGDSLLANLDTQEISLKNNVYTELNSSKEI